MLTAPNVLADKRENPRALVFRSDQVLRPACGSFLNLECGMSVNAKLFICFLYPSITMTIVSSETILWHQGGAQTTPTTAL